MKRNLKLAAALTVILVASYGSLGCPATAPGEDPVLVQAQRLHQNSMDGFDLLFKLEHDNKDLIESKLPGTHKIVNEIKKKVVGNCNLDPQPAPCDPGALDSLLAAIDTYRASGNKTKLEQWEATVTTLLEQAKAIIANLGREGFKAEESTPEELRGAAIWALGGGA